MRARSSLRAARGLLWRLRQPVNGGALLQVGRRVRVSRPARGVRLVLGRKVRLYDRVGFFLDGQGARVEIGDRTYVNRRAEITCRERVTIGRDCAISWDVLITDTDYHVLDGQPMDSAVTIGDHVWIGARSTILKGVTVGDGAVVAAGSMVVSDVPPRCVVAGVPARIVREGVSWT